MAVITITGGGSGLTVTSSDKTRPAPRVLIATRSKVHSVPTTATVPTRLRLVS